MSQNNYVESIKLIEELIKFNTTSELSNNDLIEHVVKFLSLRNIDYKLITNDDGQKTNLLAFIGDQNLPAYIISGHTDVVPADEKDWTVTQPFEPKIINSRLYGRGSADMKGFIGVALVMLAQLQQVKTKYSVILSLSFDEEIGCLGIPLVLPELSVHKHRIKGCIIGEPTEMKIGYAHKGHVSVRATIHGVGGHSGYPERGANAIDVAAELVTYIRKVALDVREKYVDDRFHPPYTTLHTGMISGGDALNKIPEKAIIDFEMRTLPGHQPDETLKKIENYFHHGLSEPIKSIAKKCQLVLECYSQYPQLNETDEDFLGLVATLASTTEQPIALGFGCEAGVFSSLGIPALVCGPGSIYQAHLPDEYIELEQITRSIKFFEKFNQLIIDGSFIE